MEMALNYGPPVLWNGKGEHACYIHYIHVCFTVFMN